MVGGVADWFAVTALFRRPLGLPIPHTALIVERKDQFAATLGQFVQENFLNADVLAERIRSAHLVPRLAAWLADQANAARFAGHAADLVVTVAEALRDEDVQRVLTAELTRAIDSVEVAPLAGRALRVIIAGGHHAELFNAIVSARRPLSRRPPRGASRAVRGRGAPLGARRGLPADLRPAVHPPARAAGGHGRRSRRRDPASVRGRGSPGSPTASRPPRSCASAGSASSATFWAAPGCGTGPRRCGRTPRRPCGPRRPTRSLSCAAGWPTRWRRPAGASARTAASHDGLERMVESGARALADQFHDELAGLVTGTIERWDAAQTSSQLELLLGRDLQFIRINGTVVGRGRRAWPCTPSPWPWPDGRGNPHGTKTMAAVSRSWSRRHRGSADAR